MNKKDLEDCRADAGELEEALKSIWKRARDDEGRGGNYYFTRSSRAGVQTPKPLKGGQRKSSLSTRAFAYPDSGGMNRNLVKCIPRKFLWGRN
jgi:hypothetical protein